MSVTVNGSSNRIYNYGIEGRDMWTEISCFFGAKIMGNLNCHIFTISNSQMNIMNKQLESVQY